MPENAGPNPFQGAAEAFAQACTGFDPQNAGDLDGMFAGLPEYFEQQAASMKAFIDKCASQFPLNPAVTEALGEIASQFAGLQDHAAEVNQVYLDSHAADRARLAAPRPGEVIFDYGRQA